MGQRNATYVIVESGKHQIIMPIYNQWNYIKIQPSKIARGIKQVLKFDWKYNSIDIIQKVYYAAAGDNTFTNKDGKNQSEWVGGIDETHEYKKGGIYTGAFQEYNNNGWNIVKFIIDNDGKVKVELFCKVGSEDENKAKSTSLSKYFFEFTNQDDIDFLKETCKWNPKLEAEADKLLTVLCLKEDHKHIIAY